MAELRECYRLLEVEPGASPEEVKRAYRELVKIWHPDRYSHDPNLQRRTTEKLKLINLAYEQISKAGFRVPPMAAEDSASRGEEPQARPAGRRGSPESKPDPQPAAPPPPPPRRRRGQSYGWRVAQWAAAVIIIGSVTKIVLSTGNSQRGRSADPRSAPQPSASEKNGRETKLKVEAEERAQAKLAAETKLKVEAEERAQAKLAAESGVKKMALIPAGSFRMGNSSGDADIKNATPISVNVSAFYMDVNLVSKAEWDEVYRWAISHGYSFEGAGSGKAANHPVQTITWHDSVKWSNARSEKENRTPAYYTDAGLVTVYRSGQLSPYVNWTRGYRLPTEAEWEKAARGGLSGQRFPWGNTISLSLANFRNDGGESYQTGPSGYNPAYATGGEPYTSPVGSFAPNGYGLYDMAGNVWQWCWDWYEESYAGGSDPHGPASGSFRVNRGGGWYGDADRCRTANRNYYNPANRGYRLGFRSVLPPGQP